MTTTEAPGLTLPRCCAHLMSWDDGPSTALTRAALPAGLPAGPRAPQSMAAHEPSSARLPAPRAVGA
ncbi:hypothetical protein ACFYM3_39140 [Streptomyces massasporeus]|uniref:Uncharacterized protein n=1 Tax=Streptomyces massasporeus TaxID=67324 RepID=A0ABW6LSD5_9ACTN